MTTSNAAADTTPKPGSEKAHEKVAEKRRALGRGLESLLPGPRVVRASPTLPPAAPTLPQSTRRDGAPESSSPSSSTSSYPSDLSSVADGGPAGTPVTPPEVVNELQAAAAGPAPDGEHAFELALDKIDGNPHQTRQEFDPIALGDLAGSIQAQGVLQPVVVRPRPVRPGGLHPESKQRYILILGERRFRASKMAGKTTIPAIVKRVSEQQAAEMTLVENLQRQDLHCLEQAAAFANLSTEFQMTQEEIGKRVGVSREQVSNYLRLLKLPPTVLMALRKGDLAYSHARLLLSLRDEGQILKVAKVAITKKMSVALLTEMIMNIDVPAGVSEERRQTGARWVDPNVRAAQRSLEMVLGMRVRIRDRKGKGKITIEYGTLEDFDRVVGMLKGK
ncbi:MAG: ParB/RepB/Spo0J family partition protein [Acidobacteriia bacterium]|nr:ParB/RepB/Spo0J family partition protein [Terriglobia bacterium]